MLLSGEILTLEGPSSLLRVRFEPIKHDIMSMCGHGTCVNIVVYAFARFFIAFSRKRSDRVLVLSSIRPSGAPLG